MLNYIGPNSGQGISIYYNAEEVTVDTTKRTAPRPPVLGRRYTGRDQEYANVDVDELIFFNQSLSTADITALYNMF